MTMRFPPRITKETKIGLTKCDDEYTVSKQREALSTEDNTGKFTVLRAETPARRNSAKTPEYGDKDFVYGVLFVTLLAFGAKTPVHTHSQRNGSAGAHQIANIFLISLAQRGKIARKRQSTINLVVIYTFSILIVL